MKTKNLILIIVISLAIVSCKKPKAGFTANKTEVYVGEVIHFFDNGDIRKNCTFTYDFGDGTNSSNNNSNLYYGGSGYYGGSSSNTNYSDRNPSHIYWQPGTYDVTQTIAVAGNLEKGKSKQVTAKLSVTVKAVIADFTMSDTTAIASTTVVHLINTTLGGDLSWWASSGYGWTYVNTTNPGQSSYVTAAYVGGNGTGAYSNEGYVTFNSPGVWKVSFGIGNGYYANWKTKIITVY
jgi:hypothetical protein